MPTPNLVSPISICIQIVVESLKHLPLRHRSIARGDQNKDSYSNMCDSSLLIECGAKHIYRQDCTRHDLHTLWYDVSLIHWCTVISWYFQCSFLKFTVCLRPFCNSFNVLFSFLTGKLSRMKTRKNCVEIAEVMTYGAIEGPSSPRWSIGGNRRLKKILLNKDRGILTKCGATEVVDGPSSPWQTVLHIRHY